jgi:Acetyltransferase (GNAT) domain
MESLPDAPSRVQLRSLVSSIVRRACPRECVPSPPGQTRPPRWWAFFLREDLVSPSQSFASLAWCLRLPPSNKTEHPGDLTQASHSRQRLNVVYACEMSLPAEMKTQRLRLRRPQPADAPEIFSRYVFARDAWGQGYATEVVKAMISLAFTQPEVRRLYALCHVEHLASAQVLEKAGLQREGKLRRYHRFPNLPATEPSDVFCYAVVR